jgi:hypothetical protein
VYDRGVTGTSGDSGRVSDPYSIKLSGNEQLRRSDVVVPHPIGQIAGFRFQESRYPDEERALRYVSDRFDILSERRK